VNSPILVPNVTPAEVAKMATELAKAPDTKVLTTSENHYSVSGHGVVASVVYNPATLLLTVQVLSKPFFVSEGMIHNEIVAALG
jgi:hypothetical protein